MQILQVCGRSVTLTVGLSLYTVVIFLVVVPFSSYLTENNVVTLNVIIQGHSRSLEMAPFDRSHHFNDGERPLT